ncbi:MAG: hypothetical protein ACE5HO_03205 [bacterium]
MVEEIREFQKNKNRLGALFIFFGVLGLVLPILPGIALLALGLLLVFPRQGEAYVQRIRSFIGLG